MAFGEVRLARVLRLRFLVIHVQVTCLGFGSGAMQVAPLLCVAGVKDGV